MVSWAASFVLARAKWEMSDKPFVDATGYASEPLPIVLRRLKNDCPFFDLVQVCDALKGNTMNRSLHLISLRTFSAIAVLCIVQSPSFGGEFVTKQNLKQIAREALDGAKAANNGPLASSDERKVNKNWEAIVEENTRERRDPKTGEERLELGRYLEHLLQRFKEVERQLRAVSN